MGVADGVGTAVSMGAGPGVKVLVRVTCGDNVRVGKGGEGVSVAERGVGVDETTVVGVATTEVGVGRPLMSQPHVPMSKARRRREAVRARFMDAIIARSRKCGNENGPDPGPPGSTGSGYDRTR